MLMLLARLLAICILATPLALLSHASDVHYPGQTATRLAFGSCHKRKAVSPEKGIVWEAIGRMRPDAFLWTGDAIYPPQKGTASVDDLMKEYHNMLTNTTVGYRQFLQQSPLPLGVHGTWDDHDYGGNDRGNEMPNRPLRRDAFLDFLGVPPEGNDDQHLAANVRRRRDGVYYSVSFGDAPHKVLVLFLDTRYHRDRHCIPSVAGGSTGTAGALFSCVMRWVTAGLNLSRYLEWCRSGQVLGEEQWRWLEDEVRRSDAQVHVVVGSVQVLTTNPAVESWGQFDSERTRLLKLVRALPGLVLLSGDVHHAEILSSHPRRDPTKAAEPCIVEVTSSGMTHSVDDMFVQKLARAQVDAFGRHRLHSQFGLHGQPSGDGDDRSSRGGNIFLGRNFGMIHIDWNGEGGDVAGRVSSNTGAASFTVNVHDHSGKVVLSTGPLPMIRSTYLTEDEIELIRKAVDGHLIPFLVTLLRVGLFFVLLAIVLRVILDRRIRPPPPSRTRKGKKIE